jgi:pyruvate-formate lyase-activating enzyme
MTDKKFNDYDWNRDDKGNILLDGHNREQMQNVLNKTGCGFCLAKWTQVTMHLGNGLTHSCHHPGAHKIPLEEIEKNPGALHNTEYKKQRRKEMLGGDRPDECGFCWRVEDNGEISDRVLKSLPYWSHKDYDNIIASTGNEDVYPSYVEVSFGNTCNFACSYCGPPFSSKWTEDIKHNGEYNILHHRYNQIKPHEVHIPTREHNPYIEAWWKWFPEALPHMRYLRITGGEPLLVKDTFKVLDFLLENPNPELEFGINSNACPPGDKWKEFVEKVNLLLENNCIKKFDLFTSAEASGVRSEYIRDGMDWYKFVSNIEYFLDNTRNTRVIFMAAFNILSLSSFKEFLEWVLELKKRYSYHGIFRWFEDLGFPMHREGDMTYNERITKREGEVHNRIGIDIPYVRHPQFLDPAICTKQLVNDHLIPALNFMYNNLGNQDYYISNRFEDYECLKLKRNTVDCVMNARKEGDDQMQTDKDLSLNRAKFAMFVQEYDRRRGKNFLVTFPEYKEFYDICIKEYQKLWGTPEEDITFEAFKNEL